MIMLSKLQSRTPATQGVLLQYNSHIQLQYNISLCGTYTCPIQALYCLFFLKFYHVQNIMHRTFPCSVTEKGIDSFFGGNSELPNRIYYKISVQPL